MYPNSLPPNFAPQRPPSLQKSHPQQCLRPTVLPLPRKEQRTVGQAAKEGGSMPEGRGKWTQDEQKIYIRFIEDNTRELECRTLRKSEKVFMQMSRSVRTRTADQCRSHHQKILKYHNSLKDIIQYYKQNLFGKQIDGGGLALKRTEHEVEGSGSFCTVYRINNRFRIEINAEEIGEFEL